MGPMLCAEYFERYSVGDNVADVSLVINALADEIDDVHLSDQFRSRIAERLEPK